MADTATRVRQVVANQFDRDVETITPETTFDELGADSLDMIELTMMLEEEFSTDIRDDERPTVSDFIKLLEPANVH